MKLRSIILLIVILCHGSTVFGQFDKDSLLRIWKDSTQTDSMRVESFNAYIWDGFLFSRPDTAFKLAKELLVFSEEKGYKCGSKIAYNHMGIASSIMGDDVRALDYFLLSLEINEELGDSNGIAACLNGIGILYQNQGQNDQALDYFNRSLIIREKIGKTGANAATLLNIGNSYGGLHNAEKSLEYYLKSLNISEKNGDKRGMARALGNIGIVYEGDGIYDKAIDYYAQSSKLFEEIGDEQGVINNLINIGGLFKKQGKYASALDYCKQGLERATNIGILWEQKLGCNCLYNTYKSMGNDNLALEYLEKVRIIDDSLAGEKALERLQQMEFAKELFTDSLNQAAIAQRIQLDHEAEIRRKNNFRNIIIVSGLFLLLLSWGLYGRWKKAIAEKNLTEEKIDRVLQYEQLRKLDMIMEGQDMERKRIAEDLHDKLGGKFNALNFTWSSIYAKELESGSEKDENLKALDNIIQSLSTEIREVIQDNARSSAGEFGLTDSLEELKYLVQSSQQMEINTLVHGIESLDKKVSLELYKVILELVSNALKYSKGTHINVHLNRVDRHIILIVEDDGVGFNVASASSGMGLKNVKARAERMGGVVEFDSKVGRGTTVILELDA